MRSAERMQSMERGLGVLEHLNRVGFATTSQIARALELKRATVHRIAGVLADLGYLYVDRPSGLLMLTAAVMSLSRRSPEDATAAAGEWAHADGSRATGVVEDGGCRIPGRTRALTRGPHIE
jgi:hypothetical protein